MPMRVVVADMRMGGLTHTLSFQFQEVQRGKLVESLGKRMDQGMPVLVLVEPPQSEVVK